ncbi:MAG: hypothetical protein F6J97_02735 [Leptolyngbya sp. SIO4C1]|nr:hypothetical protein [Leptolyngbya sp. SIO4C1]
MKALAARIDLISVVNFTKNVRNVKCGQSLFSTDFEADASEQMFRFCKAGWQAQAVEIG